jgi:hypothetical protein
MTKAFSSEVDTGSRKDNASRPNDRAPFRFHRNGKGSSLLRSRSAWITIAIAVAVLLNAGWHRYAGARMLADAGLATSKAPENVIVDLNVAPEQFHMSRLQALGTMVGAQGRSVSLRGVSPDSLAAIATRSWVANVRRMAN